jgi:raffinose/stachyose/melibiose transport system permease protein
MNQRNIARISSGFALNIFVAAASVVCLFPFLWMISSSLKTKEEFAVDILSLPINLHWENYLNAFRIGEMDKYLLNSLFVSGVSLVLLMILAFLASYVLARTRSKAIAFVSVVLISGMLIPVHGFLIPIFLLFKNAGLLNSRITLIFPYIAFGLSLAIFLLSSYMKNIPNEMEEAAFMDGATIGQTLVSIVLPMSAPALGTTVILSFLNMWNEFPFALVLLSSRELKTLPIGLTNFSGQFTSNYPLLMAGLIIALLPILILYLCTYKTIMKGMVAGALKG